MVIGMLHIFSHDVHVLLDPGSTLDYVIPFVAVSFGFEPKNILEPFSIFTPFGDSIVARRVYKNCVVSIFHRDTVANLVELDMIHFYIILGMD